MESPELPTRMPIVNDPEFDVIRMLDGHIQPSHSDQSITEHDGSNPHHVE